MLKAHDREHILSSDYEEVDGGYVSFGWNPKGGKIKRKDTIKIGNLDFENVYIVRVLKFNLSSVLQMCDKKSSVLFNDTECIVLFPNFKLTDESQGLLRVPRKNNMYSVELKNVVPKGGLTCLFAKATSDVSKLCKAFRVFNSRTRIVEENLHIRFSENTPNVVGSGSYWLFDIDALTRTINYEPIVAEKEDNVNSTNNVNNVSSTVNVTSINEDNELPFDLNMPALEDISTFKFLSDDGDDGAMAGINNVDTIIQCMRTRSSFLVIEPSSTPKRRRNKKGSKQQVDPTIFEKPVVTMADTRTIEKMLQAPIEGYGDAIVIPAILADNFELKHGLLNLMTSKQFFGFEKDDPHAHIRWFNKITSTIKPVVAKASASTSTSGLSPDVAALTDVVKALLRKNTTPPSTFVKAVEESCVTCGRPHSYTQCLATDGNAFPGYHDNIQAYVSAAAVNHNQGNTGYRPPSVAHQV
nr:ribonuclease H-like domain-containing protein [Tanacetum cinerariifolium]